MTSKTLLGLAIGGALCFGAGCQKEETATNELPKPVESATATETPSASSTDEVASYPNQMPQSGTRKTLQAFKVFQGADPTSKLLTSVGPGTLINLKASSGNWMLIEWPCGTGKMCPGWVEASVTDSRLSTLVTNVADAGPTDAGDAGDAGDAAPADAGDAGDAAPADAGDAGDAAPADAGDAGDGGRPKLKFKFPTK